MILLICICYSTINSKQTWGSFSTGYSNCYYCNLAILTKKEFPMLNILPSFETSVLKFYLFSHITYMNWRNTCRRSLRNDWPNLNYYILFLFYYLSFNKLIVGGNVKKINYLADRKANVLKTFYRSSNLLIVSETSLK